MAEHPVRDANGDTQYLNDDEIKKFLDDLDHNDDGYIDYNEVEQKLDAAHDELTPVTAAHHVTKRDHDSENDHIRHAFLRSMMGSEEQRIPRDEFAKRVKEWKIPSLEQAKKEEKQEKQYMKSVTVWRRIRAYWAVHGPEICFLALVIGMQLAFGIWQLVKYQTTPAYRAAFGWGVVMAKTCAGALYPTFFFLILSMSRYFSTFMRKSYYVSRFFNWDLSQEFHIRISCVAILLATLHALGHLTGSFVSGSDPNNETEVAYLLGDDMVPRPYIEYVRSVPGVTGITALGCFYLLSLLSIPQVRRWNYEVFQLGHLLMFPIIGLMMAHGTAHLLQWPMFGYFLAFPTLLVVVERVVRVVLGFHRIKATMKCLDDDTVEITAIIPSERLWRYKAGQYIFLQVPEISIWQWHPFTVSVCIGNKMQVHIKTDGNWTGRLRKLGGDAGESEIEVGINGPFGAPAQRFYEFNHSVIIGAGIGVTPFSGILADLQAHDDMSHGGPAHLEAGHLQDRHDSDATAADPADASGKFEKITGGDGMLLGSDEAKRKRANDCSSQQNDNDNETRPERDEFVNADTINTSRRPEAGKSRDFADDYRRVDFHWMVRDRNYLSWLSDLLNEVSRSQEWHREHEDQPHLDIRIQTHVTAKRKDIVTHVYRWLLEMHRTDDHPASPLTGLLNPTHFGRPDFNDILDRHYDEMRAFRRSKREEARGEKPGSSARREGASDAEYYKEDEELKVGVFYCGAPVVGEILADKCSELTTRGRHDGSKIEYHFMIEVFG
ncbi:conserved hypothetical protein [Verticillium alfalfae VaMs.102]|uniref:Uncharacterized protein n=1 Tax=Verticillium alfalfae (strain VaMs.102 / ATCC MYA-4576 / FGSC 10136) TaxID=526221 RepID=C9S5T9_VERA1|nr:conserved hypothetical protein [Verticillium alfalfae VaMs.102]EEY14315.1 conserved hypothetical protein [Verticillium alfalfae VaMs.102]